MEKRKSFVDYIVPIGFMLIGIACVVFAIIIFVWPDPNGIYVPDEHYNGDAYTGIQNALSDVACNINEVLYAMRFTHIFNGCAFVIAGAVLIWVGVSKIFALSKSNKTGQITVEAGNSTKNN
ncbi:MAG: hypothetical protein E7372_02385 [Clostridiales bacterium]|nr:hypothetical protein [Clostridiales bacterium]